MDWQGLEYLVVGAGLSGLTVAERLAAAGRKVAVVERRGHLGGLSSAYDEPATGIEVHRHGTHVFHTDLERVAGYLGGFCELYPYRHRVWSRTGGRTYPLPINLQTINLLTGSDFTPAQAAAFLRTAAWSRRKRLPANFKEAAIARMGGRLFAEFVEGYTAKQWGCDPAALPAALAERIAVRTDLCGDYFPDRWQGLPVEGWADVFARMAYGLEVRLGLAFDEIRDQVPAGCTVVWTGPLDGWFGYKLGRLAWRGVRHEREVLPIADFQGAAVVNYPEPHVAWTRIHEFRHLWPGTHGPRATIIAREYAGEGEGFEQAYPVDPEGKLAKEYRRAAAAEKGVVFCGRLATYRYLDMDEAIAAAIACAEGLCRS
jgi:UDP-galactopyranose mutase